MNSHSGSQNVTRCVAEEEEAKLTNIWWANDNCDNWNMWMVKIYDQKGEVKHIKLVAEWDEKNVINGRKEFENIQSGSKCDRKSKYAISLGPSI